MSQRAELETTENIEHHWPFTLQSWVKGTHKPNEIFGWVVTIISIVEMYSIFILFGCMVKENMCNIVDLKVLLWLTFTNKMEAAMTQVLNSNGKRAYHLLFFLFLYGNSGNRKTDFAQLWSLYQDDLEASHTHEDWEIARSVLIISTLWGRRVISLSQSWTTWEHSEILSQKMF